MRDKKVCKECYAPWRPKDGKCRYCDNRTWEYDTPVEVLMEDVTSEEWAELEEELRGLERSDPAVKKAAEEYKKAAKKILKNREDEDGKSK